MTRSNREELERRGLDILSLQEDELTRLQKLCDFLHEAVDYYDWVGFYFAVPRRRELVLGPYAGAATEHVRIPYGRGICGQAVVTGETFLVDDVAAEGNYLACSIHVKSEIVVPVHDEASGEVLAELDLDSHRPAAFDEEDRHLLEALARAVSPLVPRGL